MSIWCSHEDVGYEVGLKDAAKYDPRGGEVRSYAEGFSNHYPTTDGEWEQPASVGIAHVAPWCVPGWEGREDDLDYPQCGPWVRLDVVTHEHTWEDGGKPTGRDLFAAVVMDEAAARTLAADLLEWADREKVHPQTKQAAPQPEG